MKKYLLSLMLMFGIGAIALPATALPFVSANSQYTFYLQGEASDESLLGQVRFNDLAETGQLRDRAITVTESETALGNGQSKITFNLAIAGTGLFGANEGILFGIGTNGDGFDLLSDVPLTNAVITLFGGEQVLVTFEDVQDFIEQINPWSGLLPAVGSTLLLGDDGLDASQVTRISVDFLVGQASTAVPEPGSILLCAIGLLATMAALRRRS